MKPPLAILGRHSDAILLREGGRPGTVGPGFGGDALRFPSIGDADGYLLFWAGDTGAMSRLRHVLYELGHSRDVSRCSDVEVVRALAARVVDGSLELVAQEGKRLYLDVRGAFNRAAAESRAAAAAAAPSGPVVRPAAPPVVPPAVPSPALLPALEKVQIEGAEVLPEVLQTLEQIDASMSSLDLVSVSLEPTPTGVPSIGDAMAEASGSVTDAMDAL